MCRTAQRQLNGDAFTICQNARIQHVASLDGRCELRDHVWTIKSSQKEKSGCQWDPDTYRCSVRWHTHQEDPEMPAFASAWLQCFPGGSQGGGQVRNLCHAHLLRRVSVTLCWGQDCKMKRTAIQSQLYWCWAWNGRLKTREVSRVRLAGGRGGFLGVCLPPVGLCHFWCSEESCCV